MLHALEIIKNILIVLFWICEAYVVYYVFLYIIGFIFLALIAGAFIDRFSYKKCYMHVVGMVLGLAVCYLFGTVWFMFVTKMGFVASLTVCVVPFLLFDALKIAFCFTMGIGIRKALTAAHLQVYYEDTKSN